MDSKRVLNINRSIECLSSIRYKSLPQGDPAKEQAPGTTGIHPSLLHPISG
jgi:hypothetical protein